MREKNLVAAAVLSGNRNFEGRVNPDVKANYLASPPLVVAYALAGRVDVDFSSEPIGEGKDGKPVFLKDIWPTQKEIADAQKRSMSPKAFRSVYSTVDKGPAQWRKIKAKKSDLFAFAKDSTYVQEPPFFLDLSRDVRTIGGIEGARCLLLLGDSVTTDHISPAGNIKKDSPAGRFLIENGVQPIDFNSYGARRGNDRVMTRGTFANIRLRNLMCDQEGGWSKHLPSGDVLAVYDAAMRYQETNTALCVIAGKEYGTGSSRDWAAKGTFLLGVKFVLAESYERIHRSNLVGMGVLPLQFEDGQNAQSLGITGHEEFSIAIDDSIRPGQKVDVVLKDPKTGDSRTIATVCRIDTPVEVDYYRNGGILQTVLKKLLDEGQKPAKSAAAKKPAKKAAKKPAAKKPVAKPATKKAAAAKKPAAKPVAKQVAKKGAAKPMGKKPAAKPVAKKPVAKPVAKKGAAKKR